MVTREKSWKDTKKESDFIIFLRLTGAFVKTFSLQKKEQRIRLFTIG